MSDTFTFNPPRRILMGPGPSGANPRVVRAMGAPLLGHLDPEFLKIMDSCRSMLRRVMCTENPVTIATPGTGTSGMEAAVMNLVQPGDKVVCGICGYFGERIAQMAERAGGIVTRVHAPWGSPVDPSTVNDLASAKSSTPQRRRSRVRRRRARRRRGRHWSMRQELAARGFGEELKERGAVLQIVVRARSSSAPRLRPARRTRRGGALGASCSPGGTPRSPPSRSSPRCRPTASTRSRAGSCRRRAARPGSGAGAVLDVEAAGVELLDPRVGLRSARGAGAHALEKLSVTLEHRVDVELDGVVEQRRDARRCPPSRAPAGRSSPSCATDPGRRPRGRWPPGLRRTPTPWFRSRRRRAAPASCPTRRRAMRRGPCRSPCRRSKRAPPAQRELREANAAPIASTRAPADGWCFAAPASRPPTLSRRSADRGRAAPRSRDRATPSSPS